MATNENTEPGKNIDIRDLNSFKALSNIAQLYFYCKSNFLFNLAHIAANRFVNEPHKFRDVGPARTALGQLYVELGKTQELPSASQRREICVALFGSVRNDATDEYRSFDILTDGLVKAAATYATNLRTENEPELTEQLVEAARLFNGYINGLPGDSTLWSVDQLSHLAEQFAYPIMRSDGVARAFGAPAAPNESFPYRVDANGLTMSELMSGGLYPRGCAALALRVAKDGARSIAVLQKCDLDKPNKVELRSVAEIVLSWKKALVSLRNSGCKINCY